MSVCTGRRKHSEPADTLVFTFPTSGRYSSVWPVESSIRRRISWDTALPHRASRRLWRPMRGWRRAVLEQDLCVAWPLWVCETHSHPCVRMHTETHPCLHSLAHGRCTESTHVRAPFTFHLYMLTHLGLVLLPLPPGLSATASPTPLRTASLPQPPSERAMRSGQFRKTKRCKRECLARPRHGRRRLRYFFARGALEARERAALRMVKSVPSVDRGASGHDLGAELPAHRNQGEAERRRVALHLHSMIRAGGTARRQRRRVGRVNTALHFTMPCLPRLWHASSVRGWPEPLMEAAPSRERGLFGST